MKKEEIGKIQIGLGLIVLIFAIVVSINGFSSLQEKKVLEKSGQLWDANLPYMYLLPNGSGMIYNSIYGLDGLERIEQMKQTRLILTVLTALLFILAISLILQGLANTSKN